MTDIFVGSITSYDHETGQYYIRLRGSSLDTLVGVPARTLSPLPYEDGGGIKSAPIAPIDSQCMVMKTGNRHYILGFLSPHGIVSHGDVKPVRNIEPGETFLTHSTPTKLGITSTGTILLTANKWAQAAINPLLQQMTTWFRNIRINLYSGIIEYFADTQNKSSTARITIAKWVNGAGLPITPPDGSSSNPPDHFTIRAGKLDDDHIIELLISQADTGTGPKHTSTSRIGTQKDGTYFSHEAKTSTGGDTIGLSILGKNDGTLHLRLDNSNNNFVDTVVDTKNDTAYKLDINGKTQISISQSGDVTITTPDGANINVGGTGNEQQLVTKSFLDKIYLQHIHSNGNSGGPTGSPITPALPPSTKDSPGNSYTFTTKAE